MCLAIPGKVMAIEYDALGMKMGRTSFGGIVKDVCLDFTPEAKVGDYVLAHAGVALNTVNEAEAHRTYKLLAEMGQLSELEDPG